MHDIHALMANEAFVSGCWQTSAGGSDRDINWADKPPRSHRGHRGSVGGSSHWRPRTGNARHEGDTDDDRVRHTLPDRSFPERRIQEARGEFNHLRSAMRRTSCWNASTA